MGLTPSQRWAFLEGARMAALGVTSKNEDVMDRAVDNLAANPEAIDMLRKRR